eukprot:TRINITY_DN3469_c0_g1_i1.p1 TRINITY_DN3469_c0_g1~~TRINITY_DN3469_c0_g1_i1.p1  ORF type:complete len:405 (-),score=77.43 TRINITY_DN3469_c0_g1_i1:947-2161(-)
MAESKGANIARLVTKQAGRAKEKLLQNLGKADRTTDDIFDEHLYNFNLQQGFANRLHKDISNYIRCVKATHAANKALMDTLYEVYEPNWIGHDALNVQAQNSEMLWTDLEHKLSDQVLIPLTTYQSQFPEMRKKIDKRGRKLIDYDKERHNVQQQQTNPTRNEVKFARSKEQMDMARRTYEILNTELLDELPALFDSRLIFLVTNMQTIFAAQEVYHVETSKVYTEFEVIADKLAKEVQRGTLPKKVIPKAPSLNLPNNVSAATTPTPNSTMNNPPKVTNNGITMDKPNSNKDYEAINTNNNSSSSNNINGTSTPPSTNGTSKGKFPIPEGATTDNLPEGVLYRVKASYKYQAEDADELTFEEGEIMDVIEYEDPEEQEDGWLMGVKQKDGSRGMFPANFTRPM